MLECFGSTSERSGCQCRLVARNRALHIGVALVVVETETWLTSPASITYLIYFCVNNPHRHKKVWNCYCTWKCALAIFPSIGSTFRKHWIHVALVNFFLHSAHQVTAQISSAENCCAYSGGITLHADETQRCFLQRWWGPARLAHGTGLLYTVLSVFFCSCITNMPLIASCLKNLERITCSYTLSNTVGDASLAMPPYQIVRDTCSTH